MTTILQSLARAGLCVGLIAGFATTAAAEPLPEVRVIDGRFSDPNGEPIQLRGVNVGNWLLIEPWMLGAARDGFGAEYAFDQLLIERFGDERHAELKTIWRDNWITEADFERIAGFGFNVVRVPFHHQVIEDPNAPGQLDPDGVRYLDDAVRWAAAHDLYVILDMHAAPGHQSTDGPSGRVGYNRLWSDAAYQDRFVSLWGELAGRFADAPNVAAYDLVNEPWGEFNHDHADIYGATVDRAVRAVRAADADTPILVAALLGGNFEMFRPFLEDPGNEDWTGIALTDHFYPGLFGSPPELMSHARHAASLPGKLAQYEPWGTPLVIGEMQVVFERLHQPRLTRWYLDRYNEIGWVPVVWSWKLVKPEAGVQPDNWYCVTNAKPWAVDLEQDSFNTIKAKFERLGTMTYDADEELRAALTAAAADLEPFELPDPRMGERSPTLAGVPDGWTAHAIGSAEPGGTLATDGDGWTLAGHGADIFNDADDFTFVARPAAEADELTATLTDFEASGQWAKAGLMVRSSAGRDAAFALVHVFGNGRITIASRAADGETVREIHQLDEQPGDFPIRLGLRRDGDDVKLGYARGGEWVWVDPPTGVSLGDAPLVGYAVSSNMADYHSLATFDAAPH